MSNEEWRCVAEYEGLYEVSNLGRIRSLDHTTVDTKNIERSFKGRVLSLSTDSHGYNIKTLYLNGERCAFRLHRLIAQAFISNPNDLPYIDHVDGNKENNNINNLEWVTAQENTERYHSKIESSSKYNKVSFSPSHKKWIAQLLVDGKSIHIGSFDSEDDAHFAQVLSRKELKELGAEAVKEKYKKKYKPPARKYYDKHSCVWLVKYVDQSTFKISLIKKYKDEKSAYLAMRDINENNLSYSEAREKYAKKN